MKKFSKITAIYICLILLFTSCSIPAKRPESGIWYCEELRMSIDFSECNNYNPDCVKYYNEDGSCEVRRCLIDYGSGIGICSTDEEEWYLNGKFKYRNDELKVTLHYEDKTYIFVEIDDEISIVAEALTPEYASVIYDYDALLNFRLSDTFEEAYNNGKRADLNGNWTSAMEEDDDLSYKWHCMVVEMTAYLENPTKADFGYILKDINSDKFPELFWVSGDYNIHAIFTVVDGEVQLLDAFWPRYKAILTDENKIYTRGSGGAVYICYEIKELNANGEWVVTNGFEQDDTVYYELVDGEKTIIDEQQFDELLSANLFEITDNWKSQVIIPIK